MFEQNPTEHESLRRLRHRAESAVAARPVGTAHPLDWDKDRLVHELEVHQVELEMQNEELRRAHIKLTDSRDRYHELYDLAPVGYLTLDGSGTIHEANLAAAELLGVERARLPGRHLSSFLGQDHADALYLHLQDVLARNTKLGCDLVLATPTRRGGRETMIHMESIASADAAGQRTRCRSIVIDLSELHDAKEQRRVSDARTGALLDTLTDAIVGSDAAGTIESFNEAAERLFGYKEREVLGQNVRILMPPRYRDEHQRYIDRYLTTDDARIIGRASREVMGRRRDGTTFPMELGIGEWWKRGERKFTAIMRDVTARQRAEADTRQSEHRFRQIADHLEDVLAIIDRDTGRVSYASRAFETIWGRPVSDLYDRTSTWPEWIHPDDRWGFEAAYRDFVMGAPFDEVYRIVRPDGAARWVRARAFAIVEEDGSVHRDVALIHDITSEREREEELRQAQKMEAVGALATGVAHDFGNVLQAILGCVNLARHPELSPSAARQYLDRAASAVQRGADLAGQLMAFARKQTTNPEPTAIDPAIKEVAALIERLVTEQVRVEVTTGAPDEMMVADPGQIEQILMNLAANARDAMPDGGVLSIRTDSIAADDAIGRGLELTTAARYIRLVVRDSGTGMDERTRARIFEPFFTTKEVGKGTGLGLTTVFGVTKQLGGHIEVESARGQGTAFTLYFPCCEGVPRTSSAPPHEVVRFSGTALVVEDQPLVRMTVRHYLQQLGLDVLEADGADEALRVCRAHGGPIDLLVSDIVMPVMRGPKLATLLRQRYPDLRVLFMSANPAFAGEEEPELDQAPLLQKPFSKDELAEKLAALLRPDLV